MTKSRVELLQGTLDMIILRTLVFGPAHGHEISRHIERVTDDLFKVEHGSLYPALHRLERRGWLAAKWEKAATSSREFKYYRLTAAGRRQLVREQSKWNELSEAIARLLAAPRESRT